MARARELYQQAEGLAAYEDFNAATPLYEQAYFLVPGKHGFAFKVGFAAYHSDPRDCEKADQYLRHFLKYADPNKKPEWHDDAKLMLGDLAASNCVPKKEETPPPPPDDPLPPDPDDPPDLVPEHVKRQHAIEEERRRREANKMPGMLKAGIALTAIGGLAVGGGFTSLAFAHKKADSLVTLSSSSIDNTSTGFPVGDYDCRLSGAGCPPELEKQLRQLNATTVSLLIGGGALVASGAVLIVFGLKKRKENRKALLTPVVGPESAGLVWRTRF